MSDQSAQIASSLGRKPLKNQCKSSCTRPEHQLSKPLWERNGFNISRFRLFRSISYWNMFGMPFTRMTANRLLNSKQQKECNSCLTIANYCVAWNIAWTTATETTVAAPALAESTPSPNSRFSVLRVWQFRKMARTSSLNCLPCQTPHSLNASPLFIEKPFFYWHVLRHIPFPKIGSYLPPPTPSLPISLPEHGS